jgi:hypothetical protein
MTLLTPNFSDQVKTNGAAGPHVTAAHEPTREGNVPAATGEASAPSIAPVAPAQAPGPLKIAMIGTAPSSKLLAPYDDPSWTIWACSPGNMNALKRVDVWFELHSNLLWPEHESYGKPYIEWLKQQKFPILMQQDWPTTEGSMVPLQTIVPNAVPFPKNEMVARFGCDFFTSTFAWMMALAITKGAKEIALYGIDMASRDEYIRQRPGFFFFRYLARCQGIKVSAPHESDIMQSPALYAYVDSTPFGRKIMARRKEVLDRIAPMQQQRDQLNHSITYLQGAQEDLDYFESIWSGVANDMGLLQYENAQLKAEIERLKTAQTSGWTMSGNLNPEIKMSSVAVAEAAPQPATESQ